MDLLSIHAYTDGRTLPIARCVLRFDGMTGAAALNDGDAAVQAAHRNAINVNG
jgi:hypothetical protein